MSLNNPNQLDDLDVTIDQNEFNNNAKEAILTQLSQQTEAEEYAY